MAPVYATSEMKGIYSRNSEKQFETKAKMLEMLVTAYAAQEQGDRAEFIRSQSAAVLREAVTAGDPRLICLLVDTYGCAVDEVVVTPLAKRETALFYACSLHKCETQVECVTVLLERSADPMWMDGASGQTPMHQACNPRDTNATGHAQQSLTSDVANRVQSLVALLQKYSAQVNAQDNKGLTPLCAYLLSSSETDRDVTISGRGYLEHPRPEIRELYVSMAAARGEVCRFLLSCGAPATCAFRTLVHDSDVFVGAGAIAEQLLAAGASLADEEDALSGAVCGMLRGNKCNLWVLLLRKLGAAGVPMLDTSSPKSVYRSGVESFAHESD